MKDSKSVMDLKKDSMPGKTSTKAKPKDGGFMLYHLIMIGVLGLLMGAYV